MFYSHVYLARKGPLGTFWAAAHLQQRLKKSHYTATNIPKTVDLIMFPEAPLALRLSGHLLLGVVRIYSKQVDYLFRDCALVTTWLSKSFVVDLPKDARQAPVESVTLPQALNLDDFQLDDDMHEGEFDNHLRSQEDITLRDQIPTGVDPYVAIDILHIYIVLSIHPCAF
uniref:Rad21/Rec8-like protein N-terminal domain-containing protein n=1 Tax=Brassica oleracea var. oleracea TaxID=109376 RepID=A0A0D3ADM4_BRAOL